MIWESLHPTELTNRQRPGSLARDTHGQCLGVQLAGGKGLFVSSRVYPHQRVCTELPVLQRNSAAEAGHVGKKGRGIFAPIAKPDIASLEEKGIAGGQEAAREPAVDLGAPWPGLVAHTESGNPPALRCKLAIRRRAAQPLVAACSALAWRRSSGWLGERPGGSCMEQEASESVTVSLTRTSVTRPPLLPLTTPSSGSSSAAGLVDAPLAPFHKILACGLCTREPTRLQIRMRPSAEPRACGPCACATGSTGACPSLGWPGPSHSGGRRWQHRDGYSAAGPAPPLPPPPPTHYCCCCCFPPTHDPAPSPPAARHHCPSAGPAA